MQFEAELKIDTTQALVLLEDALNRSGFNVGVCFFDNGAQSFKFSILIDDEQGHK